MAKNSMIARDVKRKKIGGSPSPLSGAALMAAFAKGRPRPMERLKCTARSRAAPQQRPPTGCVTALLATGKAPWLTTAISVCAATKLPGDGSQMGLLPGVTKIQLVSHSLATNSS